MRIHAEKSFLRAFKKLTELNQREVDAAISRLPEVVGKPHEHRGTSVRRLKPGLFELRVGLRLRVVFTLSQELATLWTVGDHDHIQVWLRSIK